VDAAAHTLLRPVDPERDHQRGGGRQAHATVVVYSDYLCPYCRRLKPVLDRLREALGQRMSYVYRHFPNERVHPGAEMLARAAEAAGRQGKFWPMHDALFTREPPFTEAIVEQMAAEIGLDLDQFRADLVDPAIAERVARDLADGRANGVSATPTIFVDNARYDGAWDFYSMLEALERPVGARVRRTARAFANLPSSAGLALLVAAAVSLVCANTALAPLYSQFVNAELGIGPTGSAMAMSVADWCSEGLLAIFFLIVGLEIRREMTVGTLSDPRAALAPVLAAIGGVIVPAAIYLAINPGRTAAGWSAPSDTGIAFTLGVMALFGRRAPNSLKVFVATYAVADDLLAIGILAVFYPHNLAPAWLIAAAAMVLAMFTLNRWRVYASWPYIAAALALWTSLHLAGVSGALTGVALAAFLPTRPTPSAASLLAQAANAMAELEHAERELKKAGTKRRLEQEPIWDWASRNLSAAAARLLSPAERIERSLAPWSTYVVLPLFALTAAGVPLAANLGAPGSQRVFWGVILGLAIGKPAGIVGAAWGAAAARIAITPSDASAMAFIGVACLCGIGDPLSILIVEKAFPGSPYAAVAKLAVLVGSAAAVALGVGALMLSRPATTKAAPAAARSS
jgi:NhaA family Na+:H+ antiporter